MIKNDCFYCGAFSIFYWCTTNAAKNENCFRQMADVRGDPYITSIRITPVASYRTEKKNEKIANNVIRYDRNWVIDDCRHSSGPPHFGGVDGDKTRSGPRSAFHAKMSRLIGCICLNGFAPRAPHKWNFNERAVRFYVRDLDGYSVTVTMLTSNELLSAPLASKVRRRPHRHQLSD